MTLLQLRFLREIARQRNRITGFTEAGHAVLAMAARSVSEIESIESYAADLTGQRGRLTLATSHLHARFMLAKPVVAFNRAHPDVTLHMRQVEPNVITRLVADGEA